ncbi:chaperone, putative [Perkinsus marinus ATCC 50983]|uniref:Chaperone, putative n=1 Tax=Perkinsus marinus (strain ATCC 50983 / TXsc) TaxID=423536 RepID=C5KY79_PERM5|nr:chaperone, putative [Perkinsus marinus ATCC 50983]EER10564.1 chaperone, putative [Perkinsus marinus ATCC 50983]|eukprot:XP_002778769.1 chaperone, putative [Perkinsus marinus ATCC 50983]
MIASYDQVHEERVGDNDFVFITNNGDSQYQGKSSTLLLRGASDFVLDEAERSVHDALCATSRALESGSVVGGGGCVEAALSLHLEEFATSHRGREQVAILAFAEALMIIPKTLALNAALPDVPALVAELRVAHTRGNATAGLDLSKGEVTFSSGKSRP